MTVQSSSNKNSFMQIHPSLEKLFSKKIRIVSQNIDFINTPFMGTFLFLGQMKVNWRWTWAKMIYGIQLQCI